MGAVATLVRSVTSLTMQIPHTGEMAYDESQPKIPAAAVSPEDAMMMARLSAEGPVRVHLEMSAHMEPDADSGDVIGEIPGREHPEQVVVIGGHIDSWDVGQGAQDDGASIMACLEALALMKKLGLEPRRTLRVVFWVNEENGSRGSVAYRQWVGDQIGNHVAAIEMDGGAEAPRGYGAGVTTDPSRRCGRSRLARARRSRRDRNGGGGGADIAPLLRDGVPGLSETTVGTHYFDWHHSEADTLDKVSLEDFRKEHRDPGRDELCSGRYARPPGASRRRRARPVVGTGTPARRRREPRVARHGSAISYWNQWVEGRCWLWRWDAAWWCARCARSGRSGSTRLGNTTISRRAPTISCPASGPSPA